MKRVRLFAGIGYRGAVHETEVVYSDEEFEDIDEQELWQIADEFAQQYLEAWFEIEDFDE